LFNLKRDLTIYKRKKYDDIKSSLNGIKKVGDNYLLPLRLANKHYYRKSYINKKKKDIFIYDFRFDSDVLNNLFKDIRYYRIFIESNINIAIEFIESESIENISFQKTFSSRFFWHRYERVNTNSSKAIFPDFMSLIVYEYSITNRKDRHLNNFCLEFKGDEIIKKIRSKSILVNLIIKASIIDKIVERESPLYFAKKIMLDEDSMIRSLFKSNDLYFKPFLKQKIYLYAYVFHGVDLIEKDNKINREKLSTINSKPPDNFGISSIDDLEKIIKTIDYICEKLRLFDFSMKKKFMFKLIAKNKLDYIDYILKMNKSEIQNNRDLDKYSFINKLLDSNRRNLFSMLWFEVLLYRIISYFFNKF